MWKRAGRVFLIALFLLAAWLSGRWMVEPPSVRPHYQLTDSPVWLDDSIERESQLNAARKRLASVIDEVKQNVEKLSPKLNQRLCTPAATADIDHLEETIGRRLPTDYRAFLELHDGTSDFYFTYQFHSVEKLLELYKECVERLTYSDYGYHFKFENDGAESPRYLEIADSGVGWEIRLDLETGMTWVFQSASGASHHCNSVTHVFETLRDRGAELLKDGELWVPEFGAAPQ